MRISCFTPDETVRQNLLTAVHQPGNRTLFVGSGVLPFKEFGL